MVGYTRCKAHGVGGQLYVLSVHVSACGNNATMRQREIVVAACLY